jgi:hypothetical protein
MNITNNKTFYDVIIDRMDIILNKLYDDFQKFYGILFQQNLSENIKIKNNITKNLPSWLLIGITISIISYPSIILGITTFFFFMFIAYFYHVFTHVHKNIFSIVHHYHHENDNFFSHFIQIVLESTMPYPCVIMSLLFNIHIFDPWIILYFMLFYCSVHNVNYSIFKVNTVHSLHHKEVNVNFGPDVCDVLFGTKHYSEDCVENTNHYIPNIIVITGIVIILKYVCKDEWVKNNLLMFVLTILSLGIILLFFSSIILWHLECKKYNNNIENRLYKKNKSSSNNNIDSNGKIIDTRERTMREKVVKADADAGVSNSTHIE